MNRRDWLADSPHSRWRSLDVAPATESASKYASQRATRCSGGGYSLSSDRYRRQCSSSSSESSGSCSRFACLKITTSRRTQTLNQSRLSPVKSYFFRNAPESGNPSIIR